jgi:uncharacterized protein
LIIDDLGHQWGNGMAMVNLPGKVNLAVLPHTPHSSRLAEAGFEAGKEILLHAPMSNLGGMPLGPGGLTPELSREEFELTLMQAIDSIPHLRGVNNHMGSELTEMPLQMSWVMEALLQRELYFVDSRTTGRSVAARAAVDYRVPHLARTVFLDNERTEQAIGWHFNRLVQLAQKKGLAVGIGHPYPETSAYLRQALPTLECRGIRLALVSEVLSGGKEQQELPEENSYNPWSEPYFNTTFSHVGLGLGNSVFTEVEDAGREHGVGTAKGNALDQVIQVADTP